MAHPATSAHALAAQLTELMAGHPLGSEIHEANPFFHARLVDRSTGMAWHLTEYDPRHNIALAYLGVMAFTPWQYLRIDLLQALTHGHGTCRVEIDYLFESCEAYHFAD